MKPLLRGLAAALLLSSRAFAAPALTLDVDAREISRALLHAKIEIPAAAGEFVVWYPKWIPGIHAPGGPVHNIAGLRFETAKGESITWRRDDEEPARFHLTVPAGADRVIARLDYICNQPNANSSGVDSFGNSLLGVINWNTVLLYPESASIDEATATVRLTLPADWRYGTALRAVKPNDAPANAVTVTPRGQPHVTAFEPETLRRVVDSPLICGEHLRTIDISSKETPQAFLDLVSESPNAIALDDKLIAKYRALIAEAVALFGGANFSGYHFLVVCSDAVPNNGLEHLASSFNSVGERELIDEKKRKAWPAYLLPHELVHSWCGKFRRPATMVTKNFHTPERTRLLWIYEGLTQYLGEVLTVRSGLLTLEEFLPRFASKLDHLRDQAGRRWRSVEDTAIASWQLRSKSTAWEQLRRSQDYYDEGLVTWLEADAIIRTRSGGKHSLDDFCKAFFAVKGPDAPQVVPYEMTEVLGILRQLADYDWETFFRDRISQPKETLALAFFDTLGYRVQFSPKSSEFLTDREKERKFVSASASLGMNVNDDGKIALVVPGSVADKAGLAPSMTVTGVNSRKYSAQRLKDAIADSANGQKVELLVLEGDRFRTVALDYNEGAKFLELARVPDRQDLLAAILKPVLPGEKK
jgi:predicted metalloprotease with PDZ domain